MESIAHLNLADLPRSCCDHPDLGGERPTTLVPSPSPRHPDRLILCLTDEKKTWEVALDLLLADYDGIRKDLVGTCETNVEEAEHHLANVAQHAKKVRPWTSCLFGTTHKNKERRLRDHIRTLRETFQIAARRCRNAEEVYTALRARVQTVGEQADVPWRSICELKESQVKVCRCKSAVLYTKLQDNKAPNRSLVIRAHVIGEAFQWRLFELLREVSIKMRALRRLAERCLTMVEGLGRAVANGIAVAGTLRELKACRKMVDEKTGPVRTKRVKPNEVKPNEAQAKSREWRRKVTAAWNLHPYSKLQG